MKITLIADKPQTKPTVSYRNMHVINKITGTILLSRHFDTPEDAEDAYANYYHKNRIAVIKIEE